MAHLDLYGEKTVQPRSGTDFSRPERLPMKVSVFIWLALALASWGVVLGAASLVFA